MKVSGNLFENMIRLDAEKKRLQADLDEIKSEIRDVEEQLLGKFGEEGMSSVKVGNKTLWLDRKIWASAGGDTEGAIASLKQEGYGDMVKETVNRGSLSALVREFAKPLQTPEEVQAELPGSMAKAIKVTETNNIRVRGA